MSDKILKIAISLRVVETENYGEKRDAISQDWPQFFEKLKFNEFNHFFHPSFIVW